MHIEERITIAAPPEAIFAVYAQVDQWHTWDPDTKTASLDGPFAVGTRGRIVPTQGRGVPMTVTALAPNKSFTVEGRIPGFRMVFEHELQPVGSATQALHRVSFYGPLRFLFGPLVGRQVRHGLPKTMRSLKRLLETRERLAERTRTALWSD